MVLRVHVCARESGCLVPERPEEAVVEAAATAAAAAWRSRQEDRSHSFI